MNQFVAVCGTWKNDGRKWRFEVDIGKGCKLFDVNSYGNYADFLMILGEDFGVNLGEDEVQVSYALPKKLLASMPRNTPPVRIGNFRQLEGYFSQLKLEQIQLCVEIIKKRSTNQTCGGSTDPCRSSEEEVLLEETDAAAAVEEEEASAVEEEEEDCGVIFDFCDDSDGANSDDDNYAEFGEVSDEDEEPVLPKINRCVNDLSPVNLEINSFNLAVGQTFETKDLLETRLKTLSIVKQFDFNVDRSNPKLLIVRCWVNDCKWRLRASPVGDSTHFTVRVFCGDHTCSVTERSRRCRQATPEIIGKIYKEFVGSVDKTVLPCHVANSLNTRFGLKIDYWKAHRALSCARNLVTGSPENGYEELPSYLYLIRKSNPGSLTRLEVDDVGKFKYVFIAFAACINGFPYMRKVVVVDGTYLQGKFKGTLLTALAQDGNFQIFPLAFAIVDTENDDSWKWFFRQLNHVIPDDASLAIISDRHKSIGNAIREVYPLANRGICTYHLYKNILVKFRGREAFGLVKKAAKCFRLSEFETLFGMVQALNPALHNYLVRADVRKWARVHFPGNRYNMTTSNIAESMNNVINLSRSLPIIGLLEAIRVMLTRWFCNRRNDAAALHTQLTRGVEKLLTKRLQEARHLKVQLIDSERSEVSNGQHTHVVNLRNRSCSCRRFDLEKLPCIHALAAAEGSKVSRIMLCNSYFTRIYLANAYSMVVMPRDFSMVIPEEVKTQTCLPPDVRQPPGRPKKSRMKSAFEKANAEKRPRKGHTCSKCNQTGHNRATCPNPT